MRYSFYLAVSMSALLALPTPEHLGVAQAVKLTDTHIEPDPTLNIFAETDSSILSETSLATVNELSDVD